MEKRGKPILQFIKQIRNMKSQDYQAYIMDYLVNNGQQRTYGEVWLRCHRKLFKRWLYLREEQIVKIPCTLAVIAYLLRRNEIINILIDKFHNLYKFSYREIKWLLNPVHPVRWDNDNASIFRLSLLNYYNKDLYKFISDETCVFTSEELCNIILHSETKDLNVFELALKRLKKLEDIQQLGNCNYVLHEQNKYIAEQQKLIKDSEIRLQKLEDKYNILREYLREYL